MERFRSFIKETVRDVEAKYMAHLALHARASIDELLGNADLVYTCNGLQRELTLPPHPSSSQEVIISSFELDDSGAEMGPHHRISLFSPLGKKRLSRLRAHVTLAHRAEAQIVTPERLESTYYLFPDGSIAWSVCAHGNTAGVSTTFPLIDIGLVSAASGAIYPDWRAQRACGRALRNVIRHGKSVVE